MSYASVQHDTVLDAIADVDHTRTARVIRIRLYAWGHDNPSEWRRRSALVSTADFDDIVVLTGLYSNFARFFVINSFNHEKVDVYYGRATRSLVLLNLILLLGLIFLRLSTRVPDAPILILSLYAAFVVLVNAGVLHVFGTCGGVVIVVKKTIQAFPISPPIYTPHAYPWWSCCTCRRAGTGTFKFSAGARDLMTVCGGLMAGDRGSIQLSEMMKNGGRASTLLLGDFGRPLSHFAIIERNPFVLLTENRSLGVMGQHVTVSPGSTGSTTEARGDGRLASVFVTVVIATGDSDDEEVVFE